MVVGDAALVNGLGGIGKLSNLRYCSKESYIIIVSQ